MSKASRQQRRKIKALTPISVTYRDARDGLDIDPSNDLNMADARQPIAMTATSIAVHSRSMGWIPGMLVTIVHIPLQGGGELETLCINLLGEPLMLEWTQMFNMVMDRALLDAAAGMRLD